MRSINKTVEEVFTEIYTENKWGGSKGVFCSGEGSVNEDVISPYVKTVSQKIQSLGLSSLTFVDLGCGDFNVGKRLLPFCSTYIGVDIVKPLVLRNQEEYGNSTTHFVHLNIVEDELPDGDICFVRQVLQHLSNQQIITILQKINKYKWIFLTEHYPTNNNEIKPNIDMTCGADIRVDNNSGVYFSEPPFNLPLESLSTILEVPGVSISQRNDQGIIRTLLYKP